MPSIRNLLVPPALLVLAACTRSAPSPMPTAPAAPLETTATIRELMSAEIDPAADALWNSVTQSLSAAGEKDRQPRTAEEWEAVRHSAIVLIEATNLLVMPGRHIAPADTQPAPGELSPDAAQRRLDSHRDEFTAFALALRAVTRKALAAIDARDAPRLFDAGAEIEEACEACHLVYWYPPDVRPQR
ncbi:MAG TPA: hypothetical protein VMC02_13645 [Steroidobacteraceae bacterium]|nr:hypothetical protein [Steroidobacteraceae bacterium]